MTGTPTGSGSGWSVPAYPHEPCEAPVVEEVPDAVLTAVRRGELRTVQAPTRWHRGAVHDARGRLLTASQRTGGLGGAPAAAADPARVRAPGRARRLTGTWLYGGHWMSHFGHFVTETLTTLWPEPAAYPEVDGLVLHAFMSPHRGVSDWQRELVALTGWGGRPVEVVEDEPLRVERLLLPGRALVVNGWAHPPAATVWTRMATAAGPTDAAGPGGPEQRVFLSRTAFNDGRRAAGRAVRTDTGRDHSLDRVFAAAGFRVVAPETLPVVDQVRLAAAATVLAGCAGTALHLSAFAPSGTRVVEIGDRRSPEVAVPMQQVVDAATGHVSVHLPDRLSADEIAVRLVDLGL